MRSIYFPVILAILGGVVYHISQKSIPKNSNPVFVIILAYLVGMLLLVFFHFFNPSNKTFLDDVKELNWTAIGVGIGAAMIEVGVLLAYRTGWNIGITSTLIGAAVAILLIPVGIVTYKEHLSIWNLLGVLFCIVGLGLLVKK